MSRHSSAESLTRTASTTFLALNTNKRGITLDLEQAAGRSLFLRLAAEADVIVESFGPGISRVSASDTTR